MSLPMDNGFFAFLYWLVNTPGLGGLAVIAIVMICLGSFAAALRWILQGGEVDETTVYAYPTPALHDHE